MVTHILKPRDGGIMKGYALGRKRLSRIEKGPVTNHKNSKEKTFNNKNFHLSVFFHKIYK